MNIIFSTYERTYSSTIFGVHRCQSPVITSGYMNIKMVNSGISPYIGSAIFINVRDAIFINMKGSL